MTVLSFLIAVCSADHYMVNEAGDYDFNFKKLPFCHIQSKKKFRCLLENGMPKHDPNVLETFGTPERVKPDQVVILQAASGTGKSTFAKVAIPLLLPGKRVVVVDNTNTTPAEVAWYFDEAGLQGIPCEIWTLIPFENFFDHSTICEYRGKEFICSGEVREFVDKLVERNQHGVPRAGIEAMVHRIHSQHRNFPAWYPFREVIVGDGQWDFGEKTISINGEVLAE